MKNRTLVILMLVVLITTSCSLPFFGRSSKATPAAPTLTPDTGMQLFYGNGMQIMLPPTYVAEDIESTLPSVIDSLKQVVGNETGPIASLIDSLEGNVGWYGYDSGTPAVFPTRLVVVRNKPLEGLPISMITLGLEKMLGSESTLVDSDTITLGSRKLTRLTYSKDSTAWAAYLFKEADYLWLVLFVTTPANLAAEMAEYELSVGSIQIDAVQPAP